MAEELRVPVSNLVRNVLEEAFSVVEAVTGNVGDLIEEVIEEAERTRSRIRRRHESSPSGRRTPPPEAEAAPAETGGDEYSDVLGWQSLVLNRDGVCSRCGASLRRGENAYAGATSAGIGDIVLCCSCLDARR